MRTMSLHTYPDGFASGVELLKATGRATSLVVRRWTSLDGSVCEISELGFSDDEAEIKKRVLARAIEDGWTPRRWWKFWRWDDTPNPSPEIAEALTTAPAPATQPDTPAK